MNIGTNNYGLGNSYPLIPDKTSIKDDLKAGEPTETQNKINATEAFKMNFLGIFIGLRKS